MSQHPYTISKDDPLPGSVLVDDIVAADQALASNNSGASEPEVTYPNMWWADTVNKLIKLRSDDNTVWITVGYWDTASSIFIPFIGAYAANADSFKNRLGNGEMYIDQVKTSHAAGAAQTFTAGAAYAHAVDLWRGKCTGGNVTGQQVSAPSGALYRNAYRFTGGAGCTGVYFCQRISGDDVADLVGAASKLQVNLCSSGSLNVTWKACSATAPNDFSTVTAPFANGTFATTPSQQIFTADLALPVSAYNGVQIEFSIGAFTSGTWTTTGAQLEAGSKATLFESLPPERVLQRCQRQYCIIDMAAQASAAGAYGYVVYQFPVKMRATPSMSVISAGTALSASEVAAGALNDRCANFQILATAGNGYVIGVIKALSALL